MGAAVVSLPSSVAGGLLVLAGQGLARPGDDRRHWRDLLQSAASDVASSYAQERAGLTHDRGQGEASPDTGKVTDVVDRQRAQPAKDAPRR